MFSSYRIGPRARRYFIQGYRAQLMGRLEAALYYYRKSLDIEDSAEGHTFLGCVLGQMGWYGEAIAECHTAIAIDPDFGNAYNDIGSYLLHLERPDDAITWLIRAKVAARYETPEHAYCNMGKAYEMKRLWPLAMDEYEAALRLNPAYTAARVALTDLSALRN